MQIPKRNEKQNETGTPFPTRRPRPRPVQVRRRDREGLSGLPWCPGPTCDYCGMGIRYVVMVRSADGKEFGIGTDCAMKLYKSTNVARASEDEMSRVIREHKNKLAKASRQRREEALIAELSASIVGCEDRLRVKNHPTKYWAEQGKTLWDYLEWYNQNAGRTGRIEALRFVIKTLSQEVSNVQ